MENQNTDTEAISTEQLKGIASVILSPRMQKAAIFDKMSVEIIGFKFIALEHPERNKECTEYALLIATPCEDNSYARYHYAIIDIKAARGIYYTSNVGDRDYVLNEALPVEAIVRYNSYLKKRSLFSLHNLQIRS